MAFDVSFRTFFQTHALFGAALLCAPLGASAATLSLESFSGSHTHAGGNVGAEYVATSLADRTSDIPITPGGLAFLSTNDIYAGDIPSVASTRLGKGEARATTVGLVESDGFFFTGNVESVSTCTFKDQLSGCVPFMGSQSGVTMEFTSDMASTLYLDGFWQGGNGTESLISVVDFFDVSIRELQDVGGALNKFAIDTNIFNRNEAGGLIDAQVDLKAGKTYKFSFSQRAFSQSPDASGASDSDFGNFAFAASLVQSNDVNYYSARADALVLAPVPLPAGGMLLLTGVGGMLFLRRRQKQS